MRSTTIPGGLTATQAAVGDLVDAVLAGELRHTCHDELSGLVTAARAVQARLEAVVLGAVREVEVRRSYVEDGALTAGAWLRMHTRMTPTEATGAVATARALGSGQLPLTAAALAAGVIDPAHVRAIAAGITGAPPGAAAMIEAEAVTAATEADPRVVRALMGRFAHALDPDAADKAALARLERRGLTLVVMGDGTVFLRGQGDETGGALLATALNANSPLQPGETRSPAQRRWDALVDLARRYLASKDAPSAGGGHAHLILTLAADDLTDPDQPLSDHDTDHDDTDLDHADAFGFDHDTGAPRPHPTSRTGRGAGPGGTLSWVGPVTAATARRIGCDADVTYIRIDPAGEAAVIGRAQRFFTWSQKKAMISRDGDRCCVPYCDRPVAWGDGHHLHAWANGGPTTITNGAIPCAAHHPLFHEGGWQLRRQPDGRYVIRRRDGKTIGPEPHPPGHNRPPPLLRE